MTKGIGVIGATWQAFFGGDIGYFPRRGDGKGERIAAKDLVREIDEAIASLKVNSTDDGKILVEHAKASFTEVKQATEYQDQKTARLLTVMAFLTAAAASLFSKFVDSYPLHGWTDTPIFTISAHVLFGAYVMLVCLGALVSFHAMQTRFLAPDEAETVAQKLKSSLFFRFITTTEPKTWGGSFNQAPNDLLGQYVKNYVRETYLIAAKTGDKVRFLEPAQTLLSHAIRVLILWFVSVAFAVTFSVPAGKVPPVGTKDSSASVDAGPRDAASSAAGNASSASERVRAPTPAQGARPGVSNSR